MPMVLDVVDIWPDSVTASGMLKSKLLVRLIQSTVRFIYSKASHINVVTPGFMHNLLSLGVPAKKVSLIYNWMPSGTYQRVTANIELAEKELFQGRFTVLYAGSMGLIQNLDTILDAAELLSDVPDVQFVLIGDGLEYPKLVEMAQEKGLNNVRFLGRRAPEVMSQYFASADALIVHLKPDLLSDISIPSKTFAYMASGRPIIMAVRGDAATLVREYQIGLTVEPSNPLALAEAVRQLRAMPTKLRGKIGEAAYQAYVENFSSEIQIGRIVGVFENLLNSEDNSIVQS